MAATPLSLTSRWYIRPGREDAVLDTIRNDVVPRIEAEEPGTLTYFVHRPYAAHDSLQPLPPTDGQLLLFYEEYASPQAFKEHVSGPILTGFVERHGADFVQMGGKPYTTVTFLAREAGFARGAPHGDGAGASEAGGTQVNRHPAVMFEVLAGDQQAAKAFYQQVFDWQFEAGEEGFAYVHFPASSPALLGGVGQAQAGVPGMERATNFYCQSPSDAGRLRGPELRIPAEQSPARGLEGETHLRAEYPAGRGEADRVLPVRIRGVSE